MHSGALKKKKRFRLHGREVSGWMKQQRTLLLKSTLSPHAKDSRNTRAQGHQRFWKHIRLRQSQKVFKIRNSCDREGWNSPADGCKWISSVSKHCQWWFYFRKRHFLMHPSLLIYYIYYLYYCDLIKKERKRTWCFMFLISWTVSPLFFFSGVWKN